MTLSTDKPMPTLFTLLEGRTCRRRPPSWHIGLLLFMSGLAVGWLIAQHLS
jgi:hypothetical protein